MSKVKETLRMFFDVTRPSKNMIDDIGEILAMNNFETPENPKIVHPPHYAQGRKHEPISVIEDWELNFNLGNVLKYISRAGRKGDTLEDLQKAEYYLTREIERMKNECVSV